MAWPGPKRDPVSEAFDPAAARLLERAYARRGEWITVRLKDPTTRERTRWLELGIQVGADDDVPGGKAKTRWARGLVRSLYYQHKRAGEGGSLKFEVGRHIPASPQFDPRHPERGGLPPSRQFRIRIERSGRLAMAAVKRLPDSQRIYDDDGRPAGRWADPARRDWA